METTQTEPTQTLYLIENESFAGKGPFTGEDIENLIKTGEIGKSQKVRKVHTGKVIDARYALLSAKANDAQPSAPSKGKFVAGILMLVVGLAAVAFLFYARGENEQVRGKLFLIPGILVLGGVKMIAGNLKSFRGT